MGQISFEDVLKQDKVIKRKQRLISYVTENGELIKKRCNTVWNYCAYIMDLLIFHRIHYPYENLNLRDRKLLKKNHIDYNQGYSDMTAFLRDMNVITLTDDTYSKYHVHCQEYTLNLYEFLDVYEEAWERQLLLYKGTFEVDRSADSVLHYWKDNNTIDNSNITNKPQPSFRYFEREDIIEWLLRTYIADDDSSSIPLGEIKKSDLYKEHQDYFQAIDSADIIKVAPIYLPLADDDDLYDRDLLASYYAHRIENNPYYKKCCEEVNYLNPHMDYQIKIRISPNYKITDKGEEIKLSPGCRQFNDLCKSRKEERKANLLKDGYDLSFDIHSTIYALTRYFNKGIFDVEWDIKKQLIPNYEEMKKHKDEEPYKTQLDHIKKQLLSRIYFNQNLQSAWFGYMKHCKDSGEQGFDYDFVRKLYNDTQELMGSSNDYKGNIFIYESLWELRVLHEMVDRGCDVRNVYDCFYFKSTQTTVDEVKSIITDKLYSLRELG